VLRNQKPYALPVQCIPYAGLKETDIRQLVSALVKEMVSHGMNVAGKHFYSIPLCSEMTNLFYRFQVATALLVAGSTLTFWIPPFASTSSYSGIFQSTRLLV